MDINNFIKVNEFDVEFNINKKVLPSSGFLRYQYNPLYNLKINVDKYLKDEYGYYLDYSRNRIRINNEYINDDNFYINFELIKPIQGNSNMNNRLYITKYKNELSEFTTSNLNFKCTNPVDIEVQSSYDGSVNLLLNDDLNPPRIINTRFSPTENGMYKVVDRNGNNDTNVYNENTISSTNLYKSISLIPEINFSGINSGGELEAGNYVFYFKYVDSENNETDFIGETGVVSIFNGEINNPRSIKGGIYGEKTDKLVKFELKNLDFSYNYINIYYTISSSIEKTESTKAFKLKNKFLINKSYSEIIISGLETKDEISINDINTYYNVVSKAKTHAQVQSRYFMANVDKSEIDYEELKDLSLRIYGTPYIGSENGVGFVNENYKDSTGKYEYYNPSNIYYKLGYWDDFYRFGIVYIMNDYSLSPVFNIRGTSFDSNLNHDILYNQDSINESLLYSEFYSKTDIHDIDGNRKKVELLEDGYIFNRINKFENWKGVIKLSSLNKSQIESESTPLGLKFNISDELKNELSKYVKGYFIVRQKRIPTILSQGLTIGFDKNGSKLPLLKDFDGYFTESFINQKTSELDNNFNNRIINIKNSYPYASIIPDADLNPELYSSLFTGSQFAIKKSTSQPSTRYMYKNNNYYYFKSYTAKIDNDISKANLTYIKSDVNSKYSGTQDFSTRAGDSNVQYYSKLTDVNIDDVKDGEIKKKLNHVRGVWNSYVGIEGFEEELSLFDVMIPGFSKDLYNDYFKLRFDNNSEYYPISDRIDINKNTINMTFFRGDCFIGNYSKRMCRNFNDPEAPFNDKIISNSTWKDNYNLSISTTGTIDISKAKNINRGDVNAVKIGHWMTCKFKSNYNISLRCEDDSNDSEVLLSGKNRSFYPLSGLSTDGEYKIDESSIINTGYNSTTGDKFNLILPDVPYIKNDFSNRIIYSDIHVTDAFKNSYRIFEEGNFQDYTKEHGDIIKILEWYGNLVVIFSHGVGILPINERAVIANQTGGEVYLNSNKVISDKINMLTSKFGSTWKESVIKTSRYIYGVDSVSKKIWRTNGKSIEIISDFKVQSFLNENIKLREQDREIIDSVVNIKTHYNDNKYDIMFTFYNEIDNLNGDSNRFNICYNELSNKWTTKYSWIPGYSENINNMYFSSDRKLSKEIINLAESSNSLSSTNGIMLKDCFNEKDKPSQYLSIDDFIKSIKYKGIEICDIEGLNENIGNNILIGELVLKLDLNRDYIKEFELIDNSGLFEIIEDIKDGVKRFYLTVSYKSYMLTANPSDYLIFEEFNRNNIFDIKVLCKIKSYEYDINPVLYNDLLTIRKASYYNNIYFYLHGQSGVINDKSETKPSSWYDNQESFELEFIVCENGGVQKVFDNINIISNKVFPEYISYELIGDSYEFDDIKYIAKEIQDGDFVLSLNNSKANYLKLINTKYSYNNNGRLEVLDNDIIVNYDKSISGYTIRKNCSIRDIKNKEFGIARGNTRYKEDMFNISLDNMRYKYGKLSDINQEKSLKTKEVKPRDKFIKIRIKYKGDKLVLINSIQTMYNISFS